MHADCQDEGGHQAAPKEPCHYTLLQIQSTIWNTEMTGTLKIPNSHNILPYIKLDELKLIKSHHYIDIIFWNSSGSSVQYGEELWTPLVLNGAILEEGKSWCWTAFLVGKVKLGPTLSLRFCVCGIGSMYVPSCDNVATSSACCKWKYFSIAHLHTYRVA